MSKITVCGMCKEIGGFITNRSAAVTVVIAKPGAALPLKQDVICTDHARIISGEVADAIANGAQLTITLGPIEVE